MADINVTINPAPSVSAQVSAAPEVDVRIGEGIPKHAITHAPGGSDSLEAYYATTGSLAYISGLTTGIGNTGYLTGYVSKSETGDFYPSSNPSGFITGVDLSGYVTGDVVRPSETGAFYPNSNPSGFITGVDLSSYATQSYVTGVSGYLQNQVTNLANNTGNYVTGSVVRPNQTGAFLTTGAADSRYVLQSATGVFATQAYVTGVSGHLQTQVTAINNQTGNFALKSQTGSFVTTGQTGQFITQSVANARYVSLTGNQLISGDKTFANKLISATGFFGTNNLYGNFAYQTIAGGSSNVVSGISAFVGGGTSNKVYSEYSNIPGGANNTASGASSNICGGSFNNISASFSAIGGGVSNEILFNAFYSYIGGGVSNSIQANTYYANIGGGAYNNVQSSNSNIAGGAYNTASGSWSNIAGGRFNSTKSDFASIAGGLGAMADRYGMEARASSYFDAIGDAQKIAFTLYCDTQFDSKFFLNGVDLFDIFTKNEVLYSAAFVTCQLIGHNSQGDISQINRKLVIKKDDSTQTIAHLESIGTDMVDAGTVNFSTVGGVFFIEPATYSFRTYWIAHIYGVEIVRPTEYS